MSTQYRLKLSRYCSLINDCNETAVERWETSIRAGYSRHVLLNGMGCLGIPFFLVFAWLSMGGQSAPYALFINAVIAISVGWVFGHLTWLGTNEAYDSYIAAHGRRRRAGGDAS